MKQPNRTETGTLESRAAARAVLNAPRPPHLIIAFPSGEGDGDLATIGHRTFTRDAEESVEAFENRLVDNCPVVGHPKLILLYGDREPNSR